MIGYDFNHVAWPHILPPIQSEWIRPTFQCPREPRPPGPGNFSFNPARPAPIPFFQQLLHIGPVTDTPTPLTRLYEIFGAMDYGKPEYG